MYQIVFTIARSIASANHLHEPGILFILPFKNLEDYKFKNLDKTLDKFDYEIIDQLYTFIENDDISKWLKNYIEIRQKMKPLIKTF